MRRAPETQTLKGRRREGFAKELRLRSESDQRGTGRWREGEMGRGSGKRREGGRIHAVPWKAQGTKLWRVEWLSSRTKVRMALRQRKYHLMAWTSISRGLQHTCDILCTGCVVTAAQSANLHPNQKRKRGPLRMQTGASIKTLLWEVVDGKGRESMPRQGEDSGSWP